MERIKKFIKSLGPGLITGAADNDPSGIATYTQAGAQFGFGQLWTALFMYPLMTAIQEASARIGAVKGKGIAAVVRDHYDKKILYSVVFLVVIANTINIGADIGAMAAATGLLVPLPFAGILIFFTFSILSLEIFTSYITYSKILKWLTLALLAYPITAFIVNAPWKEILISTFVPHFELNFAFLFIITGVLGTTISPYLFFWEASEEVEEEIAKGKLRRIGGIPRIGRGFIKNMRLDNAFGMFASEITTWFIIIVAATVLHNNDITTINSAADAAKAIEPLVNSFPNAGFLAKTIFAVGIVGLGFLAIPTLAGSASYALSEAFHWHEGLYLKLRQAHGFYGVMILATLAGLLINFIGIDPVKALIYAAVFNGIVAVPLIFLIGRIANNRKIMGEYQSGRLSKSLIWLTFVVMGMSAILMFFAIRG
ncbi:MAG: divalent metal cation transporter [Candidatus Levybacteria bacterium]|nr:divalent metal cation transporter [Candidatus Levybacteria bacterium]